MPRIMGFIRDQRTHLPMPQPPANIAEATYIVTGANSGIGLECAKHLSRMGANRIILAVRSFSKGETALSTIRSETGRPDVGEVWELDLASPKSVEDFAMRLNQLDRLDALIANAGVVTANFETVEEGGMELSLVVNVVATMLLAFRALPKLEESARKVGSQTHLVVVSSNSAFESETEQHVGRLEGDIFDALSSEKNFKTLVQ